MARLGSQDPGPGAADAVHHAHLDVRLRRDVLHPGACCAGQAPQWIADVLQWNPAAVYMDLIRFALIDGYGSREPAAARLGASPWAGPC